MFELFEITCSLHSITTMTQDVRGCNGNRVCLKDIKNSESVTFGLHIFTLFGDLWLSTIDVISRLRYPTQRPKDCVHPFLVQKLNLNIHFLGGFYC